MENLANPTKTQFVGLRMTTAEREAAEREAQDLGLSLSAYARRAMRAYQQLRREGLIFDAKLYGRA